MNKLRITALFFILTLCVPIVAIPVQVKADSDVTAFAHLAGSAAPVLTALTTCAIGLIFDKASNYAVKAQATIMSNVKAGTANPDDTTNLDAIAATQKKLKLRNDCWVPIERATAQVILNTITTATINMINTGNVGSPFYEQNPSKDINQFQKNGLLDLAVTLSDKTKFPFGKDILRQTLKNYNSSYSSSQQSDLDVTIKLKYPDLGMKDFGNNLAVGGWDAFEGGFKPNNNPVGFNFKTQEHINVTLAGTDYSPVQALKDELNWGKGFLSQTTCTDSSWTATIPVMDDMTDDGIPVQKKDKNGNPMTKVNPKPCPAAATKIVTPGSQISESLSKTLGLQADALNLGSDLDSSITAIFSAGMNKLLQNGLSSLTDTTGEDTAPDNSSPDAVLNQQATVTGNATAGGLCGVSSSADWYKSYPQFDIFHDLKFTATTTVIDANGNPKIIDVNEGLIDREQALGNVLLEQNKVLRWIMQSIYTLDVCIPGPSSLTDSTKVDTIYGEIMQDYSYPGSSVDQVNEIYNAQFLSDELGVSYFPDSKIKSPAAVQKIVKTLIKRYYAALQHEYSNLHEIAVYPQYLSYYSKLPIYQQQVADNNAKLDLINGNVASLNDILKKINEFQSSSSGTSTADGTLLYKKIQDQFNNIIPVLDVSPYVSKK